MIIGTAGHVDHGKTTLVRALTGVDADRLPEEKRRGMTIDLGYAYAGALAFVDVPGHERFVHSMLAGAGGTDAALLVVAADDGVMPQTREHLAILGLLGVSRLVAAITRADLAPERVAGVAAQLAALLPPGTPVLPVSAVTGAGIDALRAALLALPAAVRGQGGHPRLAIDRAFTIAGAGVVVTGTLLAGRIAVGDRLLVSPAGLPVRVRGLHAANRPAEAAVAGARVALNLAGIERTAVGRGDWVLHPDGHAPTAMLDARIRLLPEARALRGDARVHLHLAASHVTARAAALAGPIPPGGTGLVRLTLDRPIVALALDRLVLRDHEAAATIGGGVVLDPWPPRRGGRRPERLAVLAALDQPPAAALRDLLALAPVPFPPFVRARNLTAEGAGTLLAEVGAGLLGGFALTPVDGGGLRDRLLAALAARHRAQPEEPGLTADQLARAVAAPAALFAALLQAGLRDGALRQDGRFLHLPEHVARLSAADERVWAAVRPAIVAARFSPPRVRDLLPLAAMPEPMLRAAMRRVARFGRLVEMAPDHFFLRETVAEIIAIGVALEQETGSLGTAAFRDRLGIGRKVAIQVLEFLDAAGVTRRVGEARHVAAARADRFG